MRAILLTPETRTIEEVDIEGGYKSIQDAIGGFPFDIVRISDDHDIFCDDEGLLKNPEFFTVWEDYPSGLAGKLLILSHNDEGDSTPCTMTVEEVRAKAGFGVLVRINGALCFVCDNPNMGSGGIIPVSAHGEGE